MTRWRAATAPTTCSAAQATIGCRAARRANTLDGGDGFDIATFADSNAGVIVNLATGDGAGSRLAGIEGIAGSAFNDSLQNLGADNWLSGGDGNDVLLGAAGADSLAGGAGNDNLSGGAGADALDGGAGTDTVTYAGATGGVTASLTTPSNEHRRGRGRQLPVDREPDRHRLDDRLYDNADCNLLTGGLGDDMLGGDSGGDTLDGGQGNDILNGGSSSDILTGGTGRDVFVFNATLGASNVDRIVDFAVADDRISWRAACSRAPAAGALSAASFKVGTAATTSDQHPLQQDDKRGVLR